MLNYLKTFSFQVGLPYILLLLSCLMFDEAMKISWINTEPYIRALLDNFGHAFIAGLSWLATVGVSRRGIIQGIGCGVLASAVDIDHFFWAKSFSLQEVLSLSSRPPLHSTSILIPLLPLVSILSYNYASLSILPFMVTVSVITHHLRDGVRRGLWFWPMNSTPVLPYWIYLLVIMLLPMLTSVVQHKTCVNNTIHTRGIV